MSCAGVELSWCLTEVQKNNPAYAPAGQARTETDLRHRLCIVGMSICFATIVSGLMSWIGIWRHQRKEFSPLSFAHGLTLCTSLSIIAFVAMIQYQWVDRINIMKVPQDGVNAITLIYISSGLFAILLLQLCTILALKWKSATVFQLTSATIMLLLLLLSIGLVVLCVMVIDHYPALGKWPICWSIYFAISSGSVLILVCIYAVPIKDRPQLVNVLFLMPLCILLLIPCYFNLSTSISYSKRLDNLYLSALLGIISQALLASMFILGTVWRIYQLPYKINA